MGIAPYGGWKERNSQSDAAGHIGPAAMFAKFPLPVVGADAYIGPKRENRAVLHFVLSAAAAQKQRRYYI